MRPRHERTRTAALALAPFAGMLAAAAFGLAQGSNEIREETAFRVRGYVKSFSVVFQPPREEEAAEPALMGAVRNRLRLKFDWFPAENLSLQAAYDVSPRLQDPALFAGSAFGFELDSSAYRLADLRERLLPRPGKPLGSVGVYQNLDRLSLTLKSKWGDISLGRQPIAWGSARVVNPTDVIAPFSFNELDKEERFGVDAVRWRIPLGTMSEIDAGYVFGRRFAFDKSAFYLKARFPLLGMDVAAVGLGFRESALLGLDAAGSIGRAGAWAEAAVVVPNALAGGGVAKPSEKNYVRLSAGAGTALNTRLYGFFEYHYNSAGGARPEDYGGVLSTSAYSRGSVYLLGRHYLAAGLTYEAHPLVPVTAFVLWNVLDGSAAFFPQAEYNVAENIYLAGGAFVKLGKSPRPAASGEIPAAAPLFRSEFGAYPHFVFFAFRYYF